MPWKPEQARAIFASYSKRGKRIPARTLKHLKDSLRGTSVKRKRKKRRIPKHRKD
jgi:hypothetical protein